MANSLIKYSIIKIRPFKVENINEASLKASTKEILLPNNPYSKMRDEIFSFQELENNWDGYGGVCVSKSICEKAIQFISVLNAVYIDTVTDVYPNPNGTITFEWESATNEKLALEIGQDNYSFFVKFVNENPIFADGKDIIEDFKKVTSNLDIILGEEITKALF